MTLWVFSLPQGDECEGKPLPGAKARIAVAELPRPDFAPTAPAAEEMAVPGSAAGTASPGPPRTAARDTEPAPGVHLPDPSPVAEAAVDDRAGRDDPPEKALAYNQWLADRRQGRVAEWLEQHAEIRVLEIRRSVLEHDPSRRVVVHARPLP